MAKTCLICCEQAQYFLLPPCNHKQMCWKCAITLIEGSTFSCPYCKGTPQGASCILFVNEQEMEQFTFQDVLKRNPFKSATKSYQFYSNKVVANFIQQSTSNFCRLCTQVFNNLNTLKKHLNQVHHKQYCDICLQSRKCLFSQQYLYSAAEIAVHMKKGDYSSDGQLILYHPLCSFCKTRYYDVNAFWAHIRISSHITCHICKDNYPKLINIYYRDYYQIQQHFIKSHYICQIGSCINKKLQNVFVSQQMLQQHKNRVHYQNNKHGNKAVKPVTNLILFKTENQDQLQWDKIGKNFTQQLTFAQKPYTLNNYQHHDGIIDIRSFYPEYIKDNQKMTLEDIKNAFFQQFQKGNSSTKEIHFLSVPLFCPLQMQNLTKIQLQKFIKSIYQFRFSERLIQTFFFKKFDFNSTQEYLNEIQALLKSYNPLSYYYVFPQLIRFMKDTNTTKSQMDTYYAISLRQLKINKFFIFHKMQRYSDIFILLQQQIQNYIYSQMLQQKINIQVYQTYLKDLNPTYYQSHHASIFYVQRQKMKNMYHMVQKTKTRQLLKLNWLLKLGLSNNSYKLIYDKFFYKTIDDCGQAIKNITLQEIALLYSYITICLQSMIDKKKFSQHKSNPPTFFLSTVLQKVKTCIGSKQLVILKQIQYKSMEISMKLNYYNLQTKKKNILNDQQNPSLLCQQQPIKSTNKQDSNLTLFGTQWQPSSKNTINPKVSKKPTKKKQKQKQKQQQQDFPQLFQAKQKNQIIPVKQQDQFPLFDYLEKNNKNWQNQKSGKKEKLKKQNQIHSNNVDQLKILNPNSPLTSQKPQSQNDKQQPKPSEMTKTLKTKQEIKKSQNWQKLHKNYPYQIQDEDLQNVQSQKKKKNCNGHQMQAQSPPTAEHKLESQAPQKMNQSKKEQSPQIPKVKKQKIRLDQTSSSEDQRKKKAQLQKERQQRYKKFNAEQQYRETIRNKDVLEQFPTLPSDHQSKSIINVIIDEMKPIPIKQKQKVRKGKNGKVRVQSRIDLSKL